MKNRDKKSWGLLQWAKFYTSKGFSVIPLKPRSKQPLIRWKQFQNRRPTNIELEEWFADGQNNIAIVTGKISGVTVVDLDSTDAISFADEHQFPSSPEVITGKGAHLYYKYCDGIRNFQSKDDLPNIDLRSEGGYVVAPPSFHPDGPKYEWVDGFGFDDIPLSPLPDILIPDKETQKQSIQDLTQGVAKGKRNNSLASLTGVWISQGKSYDDCLSMATEWNLKNTPSLSGGEVENTVNSIWSKHRRDKKGNIENNNFTNDLNVDDASNIFIFESEHDSEYFDALGIDNYKGVCLSPELKVDLDVFKDKNVIIYQSNNPENRKSVTGLAKNVYFDGLAQTVKVFESPVKQSFAHWFRMFFPDDLESIKDLSNPDIPKGKRNRIRPSKNLHH